MKVKKDYLLRTLAIGAYIISFFFSYQTDLNEKIPELMALMWGTASLFYWWLTNEFEKRDRKWLENSN